MNRHRAAPFPERPARLLETALKEVAAADITVDSTTQVRKAIATLDRLINLLPKFDSHSYPEGSLRQVQQARLALKTGEVEDGLRVLQHVWNSWEVFWRDTSTE